MCRVASNLILVSQPPTGPNYFTIRHSAASVVRIEDTTLLQHEIRDVDVVDVVARRHAAATQWIPPSPDPFSTKWDVRNLGVQSDPSKTFAFFQYKR